MVEAVVVVAVVAALEVDAAGAKLETHRLISNNHKNPCERDIWARKGEIYSSRDSSSRRNGGQGFSSRAAGG